MPYLAQTGFDCIGYDVGFFEDCILYPPPPYKSVKKDARNIGPDDLKNIDAVIHLAGISNDPFGNLDPANIYDPVRVYTKRLAEMCKKYGIRFIFASSCSVYGKGGKELLIETSPAFPQTPYSLNKLQIEEDLKALTDKDFSPTILRFATAFGSSPRMRFDIVINMFTGMALTSKKILLNSDGKAWRPNVHVLDICKAIKCSLEHPLTPNNALILNVGDSRNNIQVADLAQLVAGSIKGCSVEFLNQKEKNKIVELIRDRKIQDGKDTRTYQVSFQAISSIFPKFSCDWTIQKGVDEMLVKFRKLKLTPELFANQNFYRLQKMESLFDKKNVRVNI